MNTPTEQIQAALDITVDDQWGPKTDAAAAKEKAASIARHSGVVVPSDFVLITDIYHGDDWNPNATVGAVIHKASEGFHADGTGMARRAEWKAKGGLWGWYDFSTGADPLAQADFFLSTIKDHCDDSDLLVLDFENSSGGGRDMTWQEAEQWLVRVRFARPNATLCVYGSNLLTEALQANPHAFAGCLLWPARYRHEPPVLPGNRKWHIWQFTAEGRKLGMPYDDMDKVFMSAEELKAKWPRLDA